jgi:hypothetical protein
VTRLWPQSPDRLDLATHVQLDQHGYDQMSGLFLHGGSAVGVEQRRRYHAHTQFDGGPATDVMACLFSTSGWDRPTDR